MHNVLESSTINETEDGKEPYERNKLVKLYCDKLDSV